MDSDKLIPFKKMHPSIAKLKSAEDAAVAFAQVHYFIQYLVEERGSMKDLRSVLVRIRDGSEALEAIEKIYNESFDSLFAKWKVWLKTQKLPKDHAVRAEVVEFHDDSKGEKGADQKERMKIDDNRARELLRIGDLLQERGRSKAALLEYQKAETMLATPSPFLLNKISHVALKTGDQKQAMSALNKAAEVAPGYSTTWVRRGTLLLAEDKLEPAEKDLLAANAINPFDPLIHVGLSEIYRKQKNKKSLARESKALESLGMTP